jgi:hypothetical protein
MPPLLLLPLLLPLQCLRPRPPQLLAVVAVVVVLLLLVVVVVLATAAGAAALRLRPAARVLGDTSTVTTPRRRCG